MWVYKLNDELSFKQKENFDDYNEWVVWIYNTVADIFCNIDPNVINHYHEDDLLEYGITNMETIDDYKNIIKNASKGKIFVDFIPFSK